MIARNDNHILLTHDCHTMPAHFARFLRDLPEDMHSRGVMWIGQQGPIVGAAIATIVEIWACSTHDEWRNRFVYLPL